MDTRVRGKLTKRLADIARTCIRPSDLLVAANIPMAPRVAAKVPDCENCPDRCCVHKEPDSGILLSLRDVAHLVDSGLGHLIVGKFTFRRDKKGRIVEDVEEMPRLAKQPDGNCHFYEEKTGRCTGYGTRPTICRRYPYEIAYRPGSGKPFARFIPWATCPTVRVERDAAPVQQMARDAVYDENIAFEDAMLIPDMLPELRKAGFSRFLPPPEECPGYAPPRKVRAAKAKPKRAARVTNGRAPKAGKAPSRARRPAGAATPRAKKGSARAVGASRR